MQPGECWPFTGSQGYVVVQLSRKIFLTEVSIEHIPKTLAPNGMIDSAPKDCEIWVGLLCLEFRRFLMDLSLNVFVLC